MKINMGTVITPSQADPSALLSLEILESKEPDNEVRGNWLKVRTRAECIKY